MIGGDGKKAGGAARIFTRSMLQAPYPVYERLRREQPVYLDPYSGELLLTRYADAVAALKHPRLSSRGVAEGGLPLPALVRRLARPVTRILSRQILFSDPPDHTRLRSLANRAFTPRAVEGMRARVQHLADELLDRLERTTPVDLIERFAAWLPVMVIAEMLGSRLENHARIRLWSDDLALFIGGSTRPRWVVLLRGARGMIGLRRFFERCIREQRARPADNILTGLIAAEQEGDHLDADELLANAILLLAAGHETTTNLIGNGLLALLQHPQQYALLREHPEHLPAAVEELLRWDSPVQWTGRVALEEVEIGGHPVPAGQVIAIGLGAANRDPAQFPDPHRLDLLRRENRHLSFGHGAHFCLGAALARLEGEVAIGTLLRRFPGLRLAGPLPEWRENFTLRGLKNLRVTLT